MNKSIIMIPASVLLTIAALFCFGLLYLAWDFTFPEKTAPVYTTMNVPSLTRSEYVQPTEAPTEPPTEVIAEPPEPEAPYHMTLDMGTVASYHASNPDVVGWIKISGTSINYPIMQCEDNEYYMKHSWNGASSSAGAIFADFRCRPDLSDNIILYGHNMGNGSMFHGIKNYKSTDWGNSHKYIEVATLEHRYLYRVFSCNVLYGGSGANFQYWNFVEMNRTDYRNFINGIVNSATAFYGNKSRLPRDNQQDFITLQTCNSGSSDNIRCVVFAYCVGER